MAKQVPFMSKAKAVINFTRTSGQDSKEMSPHLSGIMAWTYELFKVYGWVPSQKYPKPD